MRIVFWTTTFEKEPPKLNKKEIKELVDSYETRVLHILRGLVPWSSNYFESGSFFSMPSSRSLFEEYGRKYIRPSEAEIKLILKKLDAHNPEWDDINPGMFYADLKPSMST
jgi:hypothetical protein